MEIDFQKLLNQYKEEIIFKSRNGKLTISPDEHLYWIDTDNGEYYIFETDYVYDFNDIVQLIKDRTEHVSHFMEAKAPPEKIEDTPLKNVPSNFDQFKKYISSGYGSFPVCFDS